MTKLQELINSYPTFRVAVMRTPTDKEVFVQEYRCADLAAVKETVQRHLNVGDLDALHFFEVHELRKDGQVAVLVDSGLPWPRVPTSQRNGVITPKPKVQDTLDKDVADAIEQLIADNRDKKPEPAKPASSPDYYRPLKTYTLKVA